MFLLPSLDSYTEILSCSFAAAAYLQAHPLDPNKKAYVIGQWGICEELALLNIPFIDGSTHNDCKVNFAKNQGIVQDPDVQAVIVGFDPDINYYKIQYAQLCLNENKDCRFIATNLDTVAHLTSDQEWAEAGCCVGAIQGKHTGLRKIFTVSLSVLPVYIVDTHCATIQFVSLIQAAQTRRPFWWVNHRLF